MRFKLRTIGILLSATMLAGNITLASEEGSQPTGTMARLEHAQELAEAGKHEEALKEMLWCYDEGAKVDPSFSGVRMSFLPRMIAELGKTYPPALDALRKRHQIAKERVERLKGSATPHSTMAMMELASLNHCLGDDATNLKLYDQLRAEQPESAMFKYLQVLVSEELIKVGRGDEAVEACEELRKLQDDGDHLERAWPRQPDEHITEVGKSTSGLVHRVDQNLFEKELAASKNEQQRIEILERRWNQVVLAVAHCDVVSDMSFHGSLGYWQSGFLSSGTWTVNSRGDLLTADSLSNSSTVLVRGDCRSDLLFKKGGLLTSHGPVHIYGDLDAKISVSGQSEIVIGGDIKPNGCIETDGIAHIFVGGDVEGLIFNKGNSKVWVNGNLTGEVRTGTPSATLHVMGDFRGSLKPFARAALVRLDVRGAMSSKAIQETNRHEWTEFEATIGVSDLPPGLYPKARSGGSVWAIHAQSPSGADITE